VGIALRDCADLDAPVEYWDRQHFCRCWRRMREAETKTPYPGYGKARVRDPGTW
jgi:hypothetical protein